MAIPVWSGAVSFGLVTIPVKMFNATRNKSISFHQIDDRDNQRIKYKKTNAATGEEVPKHNIVKGYELEDEQYVIIGPDELAKFFPKATKTIELEEFVDIEQIDPLFFDNSYFLVPNQVAKPYALLASTLEKSGKVGIGNIVMRDRQYIAALRGVEGRLLMSTLVYEDELIDAADLPNMDQLDEVQVTAKEMKAATQLVESLSAEFDPSKFKDKYRADVMKFIKKKASGETIEVPDHESEESGGEVVDLMAALEASVKNANHSHDVRKKRSA